ncbi:MAG TPA: ferric reductase-like transmembrane domain-containing protein [Acidimicrobiales bacterium]|nr:ferric reductase-like transmembrane domain-containing protein [Acidimicrobiales bacterium]
MDRDARLWVAAGAYALVTLAPLFVIRIGTTVPQRGFWVEFAVALGFIGLAMLCLQAVLTARYPKVTVTLGQDAMLQFHRQAGLVGFGFVMFHPVILLATDGDYWEFLDPRVNFLRAIFLIIAVVALPAIIATSLWRDRLRIPYEWWRLGHGALAVLIVIIGLVHITRVSYYLESLWKQGLWLAIGVASIGSVAYVRVLTPVRSGRHPYSVAAVEPLARRTWRVRVEPDESTHPLDFDAGQFAFVTIADSPFSLEQHPFSVASSAREATHLEFAVKELGDFSATIGDVEPGQRVYVDGPYGSLALPRGDAPGVMFLAAGIGITPIISMLRTLRDDRSEMSAVLVCANERPDDIAYRDEIDAIAEVIDLTVVHVVEHPDADWSGETGRISRELVARALPADAARWHYVVCGPPPMMEAVEGALVDLGVPIERVESERFDIGAAGMVGRRGAGVRRRVLALGALLLVAAAAFAW